jgi:protein-L-isoaspartate(D-aspartate) O-methyltransferase
MRRPAPAIDRSRSETARAALARAMLWLTGDQRIADAFQAVPREAFVPAYLADVAYEDSALPIGEGQTISQPTMIALMLQVAQLKPLDKVLDVGTGSGYQAALLTHLVAKVVGVEIIPALVERGQAALQGLGYDVVVHQALPDVLGWPAEAPYDAIIVAAGAPSVPDSLLQQLAMGGRLLIPVGGRGGQELKRVTKTAKGLREESLGGCAFVPLIGREAWQH